LWTFRTNDRDAGEHLTRDGCIILFERHYILKVH
jgi:hypothetical protein